MADSANPPGARCELLSLAVGTLDLAQKIGGKVMGVDVHPPPETGADTSRLALLRARLNGRRGSAALRHLDLAEAARRDLARFRADAESAWAAAADEITRTGRIPASAAEACLALLISETGPGVGGPLASMVRRARGALRVSAEAAARREGVDLP